MQDAKYAYIRTLIMHINLVIILYSFYEKGWKTTWMNTPACAPLDRGSLEQIFENTNGYCGVVGNCG